MVAHIGGWCAWYVLRPVQTKDRVDKKKETEGGIWTPEPGATKPMVFMTKQDVRVRVS